MPTELSQYRNVLNVIVANDFCCGCGICAGICPAGALWMGWNKYGEYAPIEDRGKCTECKLCLRVCPFWNQNENEDTLAKREFKDHPDIQYDCVTGLYLDLFAGYSKIDEHRKQGAAGGLATWFLEKMLSLGIAEGVGCVLPQGKADTLFHYSIVSSISDIRKASRSVYYPVELSEAISKILKNKGRYALVGLPCVLKGLRLAMLHNPEIHKRIVLLVGLACGQQKSKFFAEYLCALAGGNPQKLTSARFRVKDFSRSILDHRFEFSWNDNEKPLSGYIFQSEGMSKLWGYDYFKLNACNFCDDISADVADIVFCDAVHKDFISDGMGANLVLVRSVRAKEILLNGLTNNEMHLVKIPKKRFIERHRGLRRLKRHDLQHRLFLMQKNAPSAYIPIKRFHPRRYIAFWLRQSLDLREKMRILSRNTYSEYSYNKDIVGHMQRALRPLEASYELAFCLSKLYYKIVYIFFKIKKKFES